MCDITNSGRVNPGVQVFSTPYEPQSFWMMDTLDQSRDESGPNKKTVTGTHLSSRGFPVLRFNKQKSQMRCLFFLGKHN